MILGFDSVQSAVPTTEARFATGRAQDEYEGLGLLVPLGNKINCSDSRLC